MHGPGPTFSGGLSSFLYTSLMEYLRYSINSSSFSLTLHIFLNAQLHVMRESNNFNLPPFIYTSCIHFTQRDSCIVLMCHLIFPIAAMFHNSKFRIPRPPNFLGVHSFAQPTLPGELCLTSPCYRYVRQKTLFLALIT